MLYRPVYSDRPSPAAKSSNEPSMKSGFIHLLIFIIVGFALLLAFSGCTVGPNYQRPSVATPAQFTDEGNQTGTTWKEASPKDDLAKGLWWEMFSDPQLNTLEQ